MKYTKTIDLVGKTIFVNGHSPAHIIPAIADDKGHVLYEFVDGDILPDDFFDTFTNLKAAKKYKIKIVFEAEEIE